jgi:prophage regulatory protein
MSPVTTPADVQTKTRAKSRTPSQDPPERVLRLREVVSRVGLSRATVWRKIRARDFPAPLALGPQSVGWIEREIADWIAERAARRPSTTQHP